MKNRTRPMEILLVEDNEGDVFLTRKAFKQAKFNNAIHVAMDGETAMDILKNQGEHTGLSRPDIILLDINLPRKNGIEVLREIKADPDLRRIPVVILTSSQSEQDVQKIYDLHASSYIVKPGSLDKFQDVVTAIENFWFSVVTLPSNQPYRRNYAIY